MDSSRLAAALQRERKTNKALNAAMDTIRDLKRRMKKLEVQASTASQSMGRRSAVVPAEMRSLLAKGGLNVEDLKASGEPLTTDQVDALLANVGYLPVQKRIEFKVMLAQNGLLEEGRVTR